MPEWDLADLVFEALHDPVWGDPPDVWQLASYVGADPAAVHEILEDFRRVDLAHEVPLWPGEGLVWVPWWPREWAA